MKNFRFYKHAVVLILSMNACCLLAQNQNAVLAELNKIYRLYDSSVYLAFDTKYDYHTDTVLGRSKNETLSGQYSMYGPRSFSRIGNIDFLRNEKFSITAYNDQKFLMVSKLAQPKGASGILPMREVVDSLLAKYTGHYVVSLIDTTVTGNQDAPENTLKQIRFVRVANDTTAEYDYIKLTYSPFSHTLLFYEYGLQQPVEWLPEDTVPEGTPRNWNTHFAIAFTNYRVSDADIRQFSETRMIREDRPGVWEASGTYTGYTLYWAGANGTQQIKIN